jgi:very-short-patch-repair endonuclease
VNQLADPILTRGPFTVAEAKGAGLSWEALQAPRWQRLARGQYAFAALRRDVDLELQAVQRRLPEEAAFSGQTAGWIHGLDLNPCSPIEATVARDVPVRAIVGAKLRRASLAPSDVSNFRGFRVTTPLRTASDLGSRRDLVECVVALDMALHAELVDMTPLEQWVQSHSGSHGIKRLRRAVSLAEARSESPMETRLRLELVRARLPAPCVQKELYDSSGAFLARVDLFYPDIRLVIEFDGQNHRDRLVSDLRRQNALVEAGYEVLRFTAADLATKGRAGGIVRHAVARLRRRSSTHGQSGLTVQIARRNPG